ncbi:family 43 glycosylhydrolase [Carboxylicivirga sediminis]|uniref:Family 43 glycosylhydrolase n=1 Tax=Carboxylicivirga sediminis TaxID=2006564 RepID=A0A941F1I5_9BACT|nr:family 43 glycosylhydrolase [Carboxylicivirga sediminis]MBR8534070.1 family 43 glycosylhydrolase [Carboxylicivirga sediminis]
MKKLVLVLSFIVFYNIVSAQSQSGSQLAAKRSFMNPIFAGDYPDPSILVDGEDFYAVHSSFEYYPGLTIWHSRNLVNWTPLVSALTEYVGSVWAPDIAKHDGKYYIYFPANNTNYVVVSESVEGPWSAPVDLQIGNIDPGHVVDEEGNRFLYFSNGGYVPLSADGLSVTGELKHAYDGWPIPRDWSIECFCMEGPKLFKRGDYYYLIVAQGGTAGPATGHMVVAARSKSVTGPWENSPYNPIIRPKSKDEKWWSVGHATVFGDVQNDWWMLFHGYEKDHYNMGRQSLLMPVEWITDNWFKVPDNVQVDEPIKLPALAGSESTFELSDSFDGPQLNAQWKFFKDYDTLRYKLENGLTIEGKGQDIAESAPLLCVPRHHSYTAEVELEIEGDAIGGLVLFYSPKIASGILADSSNVLANLRGWQFVTEENVLNRRVWLKLKNCDNTVDMYYSYDGTTWNKIENSAEVSAYHHNVLSDFLSLRIGLVSMGAGQVTFKNYKYTPIE